MAGTLDDIPGSFPQERSRDEHSRWMQYAISIARNGKGYVSPNPLVGCVVVHNGEMISRGWHERFGGPHAEVNALDALGEVPDNAILYVNLEPCSHFGKTPPCADLIIKKKIKTVVVGMADPNPLVAGQGIARLRDHGIQVTVGMLEDECRWLNRAFIHYVTNGTPYVVLKMAQTLDGVVANTDGSPKRITSNESQKVVHALRSEFDVVLVGAGTVHADDPQLTVRDIEGRNPHRIIADRYAKLTTNYNVIRTAKETPTTVVASPEFATDEYIRTMNASHVTVILRANVLDALSEIEPPIASVLCEGGIGLARNLLAVHNAVHELHVHIAPVIDGTGQNWWPRYDEQRWRLHSTETVGSDAHLILLPLNGE